jgi:DNA mismatch endonuclease (patch repair protein)
VVFAAARVVVFCDGDFWHGRDWPVLVRKLKQGANPQYWAAKIVANRKRDGRINGELTEAGWRVIRLWEGDILKNPAGAAARVRRAVEARLPRSSCAW